MNISELRQQFEEYKALGLKLDMSRGKPSPQQVALSEEMLTKLSVCSDCFAENGFDCRNYGNLDGLPEMKRLFGEVLGVPADCVIVGGNSSLNLMFDAVARCMMFPVTDGCEPWSAQGKVSFLCPVPGYDRHFAVTQCLGINMINIPLLEDGPDMDMVESLVANDASIKGMWCVPKYSNPLGNTYSAEVVKRIASLKPAAKDFRVFWDNAYIIHDLTDTPDDLPEIFTEAKKYGNEDMFFEFASTSKITFPGAGVSCIAASPANIKRILSVMTYQTIGHDKLNQLRHVRMFPNKEALLAHMEEHKKLIYPKFQVIYKGFEEGFKGVEGVSWTNPNGGYFFTLNLPEGTAKRTVELCKEAGLVVTPAGAMFPYGVDPKDSQLRISPTFPSCEDLEKASALLAVCAKLAIAEKE